MRLEGIDHESGLAGTRTQLHRFRCTVCSYGASRSAAPERCPMCGGSSWEFEDWRPFSNLTADLSSARELDRPSATR
jgi:hypothetical protein